MKITARQYAQSLYEALGETADTGGVVKNFVKVLAQHKALAEADKIIAVFENIHNSQQGIVEGELTSARELGDETIQLLSGQITALLAVKQVQLKQTIDSKMLGGFVARLNDTVIDGSLTTQLATLKKTLTQ